MYTKVRPFNRNSARFYCTNLSALRDSVVWICGPNFFAQKYHAFCVQCAFFCASFRIFSQRLCECVHIYAKLSQKLHKVICWQLGYVCFFRLHFIYFISSFLCILWIFFSSFILWCVRKECRFHLNKFYWCFTDFFDILAWRNNAMINEWTNILHQPNDGTRTLCEMQFVFRECVMIGQSANFIFIRSNNIVANVLTLCVFSFVFFCCSFAFWLNN